MRFVVFELLQAKYFVDVAGKSLSRPFFRGWGYGQLAVGVECTKMYQTGAGHKIIIGASLNLCSDFRYVALFRNKRDSQASDWRRNLRPNFWKIHPL